MENSQPAPTTGGLNTVEKKQPLADELLGTTAPKQYDFAPEAYLNPQNIEYTPDSNPANKIGGKTEGLNLNEQYKGMIGDVLVDLLHKKMSQEEISGLIAEFEQPKAEETAQTETRDMENVTAENQKEVANQNSPLSHATEVIHMWFSKHKKVALILTAIELAHPSTVSARGHYGAGLQSKLTTELYAIPSYVRTQAFAGQSLGWTEAYAAQSIARTNQFAEQSAATTAQYAEASVGNLYIAAMKSEDVRYQQDLAGMDQFTTQTKQGVEQLYRQLQTTEDPKMRDTLQQQINNLENQFVQKSTQIESFHQQMVEKRIL